jgi:hypothetical protein
MNALPGNHKVSNQFVPINWRLTGFGSLLPVAWEVSLSTLEPFCDIDEFFSLCS